MGVVGVRLLGELGVEVDGRPVDLGTPRQRCVLAALAVDAGRVVSVDRLVERVWGVDGALRSRASLHNYISRLRRVLAVADGIAIVRRSGGYALISETTEPVVDLHRFRALRAAAEAEVDDEQALRLLSDALELWRGQALTGVQGEWADAERDRLGLERLAAQHDLAESLLRLCRGGDLVAELDARTADHPLDERIAGQYMLALHQAGRTADALAHFRLLRERLIEELGTDPGPALQNLHGRILATDPTLTTTPGADKPPMAPAQLPVAPARFTGRAAQLAELDRVLAVSDDSPVRDGGPDGAATAVISAIGGTGGIGKTWLALTWAHRNLHRFPDGQLSVDLRGFSPGEPKQPTDVLADFLAALGVDRDHQPSDPDARAALYRTHTTNKRMLVLLDNAATLDQVVPLLPGGTTCTVLITSRDRLRGLVARHSAHPVQIDVFTGSEARGLLNTTLGDTRATTRTRRTVTELIRLCGGFPLALGLVAARVRTHPDLLDDIVTELRELGLDALDSDDPETSLPTVLSWSLRNLTGEQRTVFGLLGIAPGPDTTLPAVVALTDLPTAAARKALATLEAASLVERRPHGRYAMHDLVRGYAAATAHTTLSDEVREQALIRVMDFHLHTAHTADRLLDPHSPLVRPDPPAPGVQPLPLGDVAAATNWLEAEHATLLATQRAAVALGRHRTVWQLAWTLNTFLFRWGHWRDALASWRAAVAAAAHLPDPAARSSAHRFIGHACTRLGRYEEGAEHLNRALDLAVRHHDATEQAHNHRALAFAWGRRGDDQRALDHARHALELYRTLDQPVWEADALNVVGWYAARLGDFDTARDHCRAALDLNRRHRHPTGEAAALDSLGFIAHRAGDHRQAVDHYSGALTLFRTLGHTYQVAATLDNLGHPHLALGQRDRAREAWQEAVELYRKHGCDSDAERVQGQVDDLGQPTHPASNGSVSDNSH